MPLGGLLPYGPQMPMGAPGMGPMGPAAGMAGMMGGGMPGANMAQPGAMGGKEPIQEAGEQLITQLLKLAGTNPQLLLGLSMAGAAREISQLTGLSRRRQGGGAGGQKGGAMPPAAQLLAGNMGDIDRILALQTMMGGGAGASPIPIGAQPPALRGPAPSPLLQALQGQSAGLV